MSSRQLRSPVKRVPCLRSFPYPKNIAKSQTRASASISTTRRRARFQTRTRKAHEVFQEDVIDIIMKFLNFRDAELLAMIYGHVSKDKKGAKKLLETRQSPVIYLGTYFGNENAKILLDVIRATGTILSGSMAANYFTPGLATTDSPASTLRYAVL